MSLKIWATLAAITILGLLWLRAPTIAGPYYLAQGSRALSQADAPAAIDHLATAARWQPERAGIQRKLAQTYLQAGQPEEALAAAQAALRLEPDAPESRLVLGDVYDQLGQAGQAVAQYEAGQIGDRSIPLTVNYLRLADDLWAEGRRDEAAAIWRDKVRALGYADLYVKWRLATYYRAQGIPSSFEAKVALYVSPDEVERAFAQPRFESYAKEAVAGLVADGLWTREKLLHMLVYLSQREPNDAAEVLIQHLLIIYPDDADLHYYLGDVYYQRGDAGAAAAAYQQAIRLDPASENAYLRLGRLAEAVQADEEATRWYTLWAEQSPDAWLAQKKLAETNRRLGRIAEAEQSEQRWLVQLAGLGPTVVVSQTLDSGWTFLGYRTDEARLVRGETPPLVLYWQGPGQAGTAADGWFALSDDRWVQVVDEASNLVVNGGFELGQIDASPLGFPRDIYRAGPETRKLNLLNIGEQAITVAWLDNSDIYSRTSFVTDPIPVSPEASLYLQTGRLLSPNGSAFLGRRWVGDMLDPAERRYSYVITSWQADNWTHFAGVSLPMAGADRVEIWLLNFRSLGDVFFDDIGFVKVGNPDH